MIANWAGHAAAEPLAFRDAGDESGLFPHVAGIAGHGVMWGDVDGNGYPDLYVGTFGGAPYGSKANQFFRNDAGKFTLDDQPALRVLGRANGGVFADFDNDGDLDLYITNHAIDGGKTDPHYAEPNHLFRNEGGGKFTDVSAESNACPKGIAARSATVLDYDGDGLVDLLVGECFFQGGMSRTRLYRNLGGLKFQHVSQDVGLPVELTGFGVATGDVNGDTWPDIFTGGRLHGNRLFINDGKGRFTELPATQGNFQWDYGANRILDDTACGVVIGDVNRDGRPDILVGSHYSHPWIEEAGGVAMRLYLQQAVASGSPAFVDVTEQVGLTPLAMKSPHVEIQDFDNDGWPDLYTSILKRANGKLYPIIFRGQGVQNGLPKFQMEGWEVNDFPTAEDRKMPGTGAFYDKMKADNKIIYTAPGPSADYDRDGRLDLFLANWWVDDRSFLLHNETKSGNWLAISIIGGEGVNKQGIGSAVRIYKAGMLGDPAGLIGSKEIAVGYGYASGQEAIAHFGLGELASCDVEVILPHGKGKIEQKGVKANQRMTLGK